MKCALYVRSATPGKSFQNQLELLENFIAEKDWEAHKTYTDIGSGFKNDHEGITQLIQDAENKKFDVIITKDIASISRDLILYYEFRKKLSLSQTHFIALNNGINTIENIEHDFNFIRELILGPRRITLSPSDMEDETL